MFTCFTSHPAFTSSSRANASPFLHAACRAVSPSLFVQRVKRHAMNGLRSFSSPFACCRRDRPRVDQQLKNKKRQTSDNMLQLGMERLKTNKCTDTVEYIATSTSNWAGAAVAPQYIKSKIVCTQSARNTPANPPAPSRRLQRHKAAARHQLLLLPHRPSPSAPCTAGSSRQQFYACCCPFQRRSTAAALRRTTTVGEEPSKRTTTQLA